MPIEIKELHIKVSVNATPGQVMTSEVSTAKNVQGDNEKESIVAECVEQVLEILRNKKER